MALFGTVTESEILFQLVVCFIVAASLEIVIVGPIAKKIAFALPYDKSKKIFAVVSLSFFMVIGMVLCMSLYGLGTAYFFNSLNGSSLLESYFSLVIKNFVFALPLQLLIVGPLVRYLFTKFVKGKISSVALS